MNNRIVRGVNLAAAKRTFFGIPEYSVKGKALLEFEQGKAEHAKSNLSLKSQISNLNTL